MALFKRIFLFFLIVLNSCDRKKSLSDISLSFFECQIRGKCLGPSSYAMVGDSWADFAIGYTIVEDLYDQLTNRYHYKISASNIAGLTLKFELEQRKGFLNVIRDAGPELEFFLLSIGGNDLIFPVSTFSTQGIEVTIEKRTKEIKNRLKELIFNGSQYKFNLYGGKPLKWVVHGYDYPNPEFDDSCILDAIISGMSREEAMTILQRSVDQLNLIYSELANEIPNFYYIDLRKTLGGPPFSSSTLMFDCIHPNSIGFNLLAENYVNKLKVIENL